MGQPEPQPHDTADAVSWAPEFDHQAPAPTEVTDPTDVNYVEPAEDAIVAPDQAVGDQT